MDNELICCIDMFAKDQILITPEGDKIKVNFDEFNESVFCYCRVSGIRKIHLFGDNHYIRGLIERGIISFNKYTEFKIEVEVN